MNLKIFIQKSAIVFITLFLAGCTAIPDAGTRLYVYNKMERVQIGNTPEQVIYLMGGQPDYVSSLKNGADVFDVWEYTVGNFLYSETAVLLFKNNRVFAIPQSQQDLIGILYSNGILRNVEFWSKDGLKART
ncbi:MAG TPA: hypothetical protein PLY88_02345 [Candidatus Omnitrophota bacterium]|nr:hypothetical protein [Candidatus Omnitrophota bacterium]